MQPLQLPSESFIQFFLKKKTPIRIEYLSSGMKNSDLPKSQVPEFALVGRSNVGKSSLLNFLAGQKNLARVSNTPGRTQTINLFQAEGGAFLIDDLPGYGYAESPFSTRAHWQESLQEFFEQRTGLCAIFFLLDMRREIEPEDRALCQWLISCGLEVIAVQTKCDKIHKSQWHAVRKKHALDLGLNVENIVTTSSQKKIGLEDLIKTIGNLLNGLHQ